MKTYFIFTIKQKIWRFFFLYFLEATRTLGQIKSRSLSEEFWVDVIGNKVWGRTVLSQPEESTLTQVELFFYMWPKGFWAWLYLLRNLQWRSLHEEIFSQTLSQHCVCSHNKPLSHFSRHELMKFPAHASHI